MKKFIFASLFGITALLAENASAARTDYNADGYSDIPVVYSQADGTLQWRIFEPHTGDNELLFASFGHVGDRVIPANWLEDDEAVPGFITSPSAASGNRALWTLRYYKNQTGALDYKDYTRSLGRPGDIIVSGGDFNGDGIGDSLIFKQSTRKMGLRVNWFTTDYNSSALGTERVYVPFGAKGSKLFFLSPDGNGDWFAAIKGNGRDAFIQIKNPFTEETRDFSFVNVPVSNLPKPVHQPSGGDLLAFYRRKGNSTIVSFRSLSGDSIEEVTLPGKGEVLTGNFTDDPGDEIAVRDGSTFTFHNPLNGLTTSMTGPDGGKAYDSINVSSIPK